MLSARLTKIKLIGAFLGLFSISYGQAQIDHWETVVYEYNTWRYLVPTGPVAEDWNTIEFDDGDWGSGNGGFGYGDGDDNTTVPSGTRTIFQRIEFNIVDKDVINAGALTIDYDDGFVAYLNGVEIRRDLVEGTAWDDLSTGLHEAQLYDGQYPAQYTITESFLEENLNNGLNVLSVQTHNESVFSSDLSSRVYLSLGITDESSDYGAPPGWFNPPVILENSNLPIVVINTVDNVSIPDEPKVWATMGIINNDSGLNLVTDPFNEFFGEIGIEIRGSSSAMFPKKAYGLETRGPDSTNYNASIFNWPADNDWILYAPYSDKSLVRNVLTYTIGTELGNYSPRTELVEVVLNGDYIGVYVFTERIKQNPGRVNIDELTLEDTAGVDITGGYIVKIDKTTAGGVIAWTSPYTQAWPAWGPIRFQMHDPEIPEMNEQQLDYIEGYITDFEDALAGADYMDPIDGYRPYIDVRSFVDFMIVNEISKNVDGYRISTFFHKQKDTEGGKLVAGPLWDFNLGWGNANYCAGGSTSGWEIYFNNVCGGGGDLNNPFWWNRLVTDPEFAHDLNCRWQELRMTTLHTDTLLNFIDELETLLEEPAERNFQRWPVLGEYVWPNNYVGDTYAEEMDYLRSWMVDRLDWMDENMFGSCEDLGVSDYEIPVSVYFYPNPTKDEGNLVFSESIQHGEVIITNLLGEVIVKQSFNNQSTISLSLIDLESGIYLLDVYSGQELISNQKIIKQ